MIFHDQLKLFDKNFFNQRNLIYLQGGGESLAKKFEEQIEGTNEGEKTEQDGNAKLDKIKIGEETIDLTKSDGSLDKRNYVKAINKIEQTAKQQINNSLNALNISLDDTVQFAQINNMVRQLESNISNGLLQLTNSKDPYTEYAGGETLKIYFDQYLSLIKKIENMGASTSSNKTHESTYHAHSGGISAPTSNRVSTPSSANAMSFRPNDDEEQPLSQKELGEITERTLQTEINYKKANANIAKRAQEIMEHKDSKITSPDRAVRVISRILSSLPPGTDLESCNLTDTGGTDITLKIGDKKVPIHINQHYDGIYGAAKLVRDKVVHTAEAALIKGDLPIAQDKEARVKNATKNIEYGQFNAMAPDIQKFIKDSGRDIVNVSMSDFNGGADNHYVNITLFERNKDGTVTPIETRIPHIDNTAEAADAFKNASNRALNEPDKYTALTTQRHINTVMKDADLSLFEETQVAKKNTEEQGTKQPNQPAEKDITVAQTDIPKESSTQTETSGSKESKVETKSTPKSESTVPPPSASPTASPPKPPKAA